MLTAIHLACIVLDMSNDRLWSTEQQRWIYPDEFPERIQHAFWAAMSATPLAIGAASEVRALLPDDLWSRMAELLRTER